MISGKKLIEFIEEEGLCNVDYHDREYYVRWRDDAEEEIDKFMEQQSHPTSMIDHDLDDPTVRDNITGKPMEETP